MRVLQTRKVVRVGFAGQGSGTGYLALAPDHKEAALTSDGYYRTGDLAYVQIIDGERCISIDGRIKDLINRGGEKVNAEEIELLLLHHLSSVGNHEGTSPFAQARVGHGHDRRLPDAGIWRGIRSRRRSSRDINALSCCRSGP